MTDRWRAVLDERAKAVALVERIKAKADDVNDPAHEQAQALLVEVKAELAELDKRLLHAFKP